MPWRSCCRLPDCDRSACGPLGLPAWRRSRSPGAGGKIHNDFREAARLPQRPFRVIGLDFRVERRLQDADLEYLAGFPGLESLMLMNGTALTDASMRHVGSLKASGRYS